MKLPGLSRFFFCTFTRGTSKRIQPKFTPAIMFEKKTSHLKHGFSNVNHFPVQNVVSFFGTFFCGAGE